MNRVADIPEGPATRPRDGRTPAFGFIFVSAVTAAMSFGLMIPILPNLIKQMAGGDAAQAADWNVVFATLGGMMSFVFGPVWGMLSDRFGRRPILLIALTGLGVDFLVMGFAPNLYWLLLGRVVSGATAATFSTANAYVADVTPPEGRARAFGWMGSAFSFGFLAGPAIGGVLGGIDLRLPFFAAAALTLANALYGLLVLPESLPPARRIARFELRRANPLGSLRLLRSHHELLGLAGVGFLNQLGQMVWPSIYVLYTGFRYGWSPLVTGLAMMGGGVLGVLVQGVVVGPVVKRIGERGALLVGATASTCGLAWYGSAPTGLIYLLGMPLSAFAGLLIPGLQGLMTRRVQPTEQGQLQGANQSLLGMASIIGPALFGLSFAWSVRHPGAHIPGLGMYVAAAVMGSCLLLALRVAPRPGVVEVGGVGRTPGELSPLFGEPDAVYSDLSGGQET